LRRVFCFTKNSSCAHSAAPRFQNEPAALGFVLGGTGVRVSYRSRRLLFYKSHRSFTSSLLLSKRNPLRWASFWVGKRGCIIYNRAVRAFMVPGGFFHICRLDSANRKGSALHDRIFHSHPKQ